MLTTGEKAPTAANRDFLTPLLGGYVGVAPFAILSGLDGRVRSTARSRCGPSEVCGRADCQLQPLPQSWHYHVGQSVTRTSLVHIVTSGMRAQAARHVRGRQSTTPGPQVIDRWAQLNRFDRAMVDSTRGKPLLNTSAATCVPCSGGSVNAGFRSIVCLAKGAARCSPTSMSLRSGFVRDLGRSQRKPREHSWRKQLRLRWAFRTRHYPPSQVRITGFAILLLRWPLCSCSSV